jgi:hypothetical protein
VPVLFLVPSGFAQPANKTAEPAMTVKFNFKFFISKPSLYQTLGGTSWLKKSFQGYHRCRPVRVIERSDRIAGWWMTGVFNGLIWLNST